MIRKKIYKNKSKVLIGTYTVIFILIILFANNSNIVRAEENYSNYLTYDDSLSTDKDYAKILLENPTSANNYRMLFETGFLFPYRLSTDMYSTSISTNPSRYLMNQIYLNNLDNDYSFSSFSSNDIYSTKSYVNNYTDLSMNYGNFNNSEKEYILKEIYPDGDIYATWNDYGSGIGDYDRVNDYEIITNGISTGFIPQYTNERFTLENITIDNPNDYYIDYIQLLSFNSEQGSGYSWNISYSFSFDNYQNEKVIESNYDWYKWYSNYWYNLNLSISEFNEVNVNIMNLEYSGYYGIAIASLLLRVYLLPYENEMVLYNNDSYYYNYLTEVSGNSGLFPSEYTFTDLSVGTINTNIDWVDSIDTYCTATILSSYSNHDKVMDVNVDSDYNGASHNLASKTSGTTEFWIRYHYNNKFSVITLTDTGTNQIFLQAHTDGTLRYYDSSYHVIGSYLSNTWYHYRIDWDCTSDWHLWINQISIDGGAGYNFRGAPTNMKSHEFTGLNGADMTVDAIDYDDSEGYYNYRNYYDINYQLNFTSELNIDYSGNSYDNLDSLEFEYSLKSNISNTEIDLYGLSQITDTYELIDSNVLDTSIIKYSYSFSINYTYFSRLGVFSFKICTGNSLNNVISIDSLSLNCIFSNYTLNNNGYHSLNLKFLRENNVGAHYGNISLNFNLYKDFFEYYYTEINTDADSYSKYKFVNFSNYINEIEEFEIQAHVRYGLNTLDVYVINIMYIIYINYNYTYTIYEQLWNGNQQANYFTNLFDYTPNNFNRLNLTGIYGNYSSNCLRGIRLLRSFQDIEYNRYFLIPFFDEKISVSSGYVGSSGQSSGEPTLPTSNYWEYETFVISDSSKIPIEYGNFSTEFQSIKSEQVTAKYSYYEKITKRSDWGSWKITLGDLKFSLNPIRNAFVDFINFMYISAQRFLFYTLTSANYLLTYIYTNILVLIWNNPVYWSFYLYVHISWLSILAIQLIFETIIWIWRNWIIPFSEWFYTIFLPWVIYWIIDIGAWIIAWLIVLITFGRADLVEMHDMIQEFLLLMVEEIIEMMNVFITHIDSVIYFLFLYMYNMLILLFTYLYCRSRGYKKKADKIYDTLQFYIFPFVWIYRKLRELMNFKPI